MKAAGFSRHGKPDVLSIEGIPDLTPGAGEQGRVVLQPQSLGASP